MFAGATGRTVPRGNGASPVVNVSWDDAVAYATWLAAATGRPYRLPVEAEWEYAARAGDAETGDDGLADAAPASQNGPGPVDAREPNAWGFHNMQGAVSEWVADCADEAEADAPTDAASADETSGDETSEDEAVAEAVPGVVCESRLRRGSSWIQPLPNEGIAARSVNRTGYRSLDTGFRVAVAET